jgi:N-acetylglucosaminyl-diphospho-decaprenol L-rhamnosyltransferase
MSASLDIVIVNWNTGAHLRSCLESIALAIQENFAIGKVTVVDNASRDGSAADLDDIDVPLEVVWNSDNRGFAAACNQGARGSEADYILFLNPDARVFPDTLADVVRHMESGASMSVGICGVQLVDRNGAPTVSCSRFPTLRIVFGKMTGLDRLAPGVFPPHHLPPRSLQANRVVDQVIGAFFVVRRPLFERLNGFDTRYFVYFEEVDFALRAHRLGVSTYFLKDAHAYHEGNISSDQVHAARLFYSLSSRHLFARKHWPPWQSALLPGLAFTVELPARLVRAAVDRDYAEITATLSAYGRFFRGLLRSGPNPTSASRSTPG